MKNKLGFIICMVSLLGLVLPAAAYPDPNGIRDAAVRKAQTSVGLIRLGDEYPPALKFLGQKYVLAKTDYSSNEYIAEDGLDKIVIHKIIETEDNADLLDCPNCAYADYPINAFLNSDSVISADTRDEKDMQVSCQGTYGDNLRYRVGRFIRVEDGLFILEVIIEAPLQNEKKLAEKKDGVFEAVHNTSKGVIMEGFVDSKFCTFGEDCRQEKQAKPEEKPKKGHVGNPGPIKHRKNNTAVLEFLGTSYTFNRVIANDHTWYFPIVRHGVGIHQNEMLENDVVNSYVPEGVDPEKVMIPAIYIVKMEGASLEEALEPLKHRGSDVTEEKKYRDYTMYSESSRYKGTDFYAVVRTFELGEDILQVQVVLKRDNKMRGQQWEEKKEKAFKAVESTEIGVLTEHFVEQEEEED